MKNKNVSAMIQLAASVISNANNKSNAANNKLER